MCEICYANNATYHITERLPSGRFGTRSLGREMPMYLPCSSSLHFDRRAWRKIFRIKSGEYLAFCLNHGFKIIQESKRKLEALSQVPFVSDSL